MLNTVSNAIELMARLAITEERRNTLIDQTENDEQLTELKHLTSEGWSKKEWVNFE